MKKSKEIKNLLMSPDIETVKLGIQLCSSKEDRNNIINWLRYYLKNKKLLQYYTILDVIHKSIKSYNLNSWIDEGD